MTLKLSKSLYARSSSQYLIIFIFTITILLQVSNILIPLSVEATSSQNASILSGSRNQSSLRAGSQAGTCPTSIGIAPEADQNNLIEIGCVAKVFQNCQRFDTSLGYVLGSLRVSIKGISGNDCHIDLLYEVERGQSNMTCLIPLDRKPLWSNWKRGDGFDAIDDIINYCTRQ